MNTDHKGTPIVLLHGYVSALAFWMLNLDEFAAHRPVYAIDLLGFGKSSRPCFSTIPSEIEEQYVMFLERWRESMNIPKMILLGHSLGGFICSVYAMKYPERVEHLILADPWGYTPAPDMKEHSFFRRQLIRLFMKFAPFSMVRAAGPLGPRFLRATRQDIVGKFESIYEDHQKKTVSEYIYHCNNVRTTGEQAFHRLLHNGPWAASPIGEKVRSQICHSIPMTFIYGETSWIDSTCGQFIAASRPNSYTHIAIVENAGHKVFSDNEKVFNKLVIEACKKLKTSNQES
jgi:pimeloyl-ACP methyl ester carboxylesterase